MGGAGFRYRMPGGALPTVFGAGLPQRGPALESPPRSPIIRARRGC